MHIIEARELDSHVNIAIVVSRFNSEITDLLLKECTDRLLELDIPRDHISVVHVPGAIEIPLVAKKLADRKKYDAIIALGCVIRGETSHYDYVCEQASMGCQQVMMECEIPVIFGVLTTEDEHQALVRINGKKCYKGREVADTALEMISIVKQI